MVLRFFLLAIVFLLVSCVSIDRNNPDDPGSYNYQGVKLKSSSSRVSSSSSVPIQTGMISGDPFNYESDTYETVIIGGKTWFKRNLNYAVEGSECYNNDPAKCATYGRLYSWAIAMKLPLDCNFNSCESEINTKHQGICPDGWYIPSNTDWDVLMAATGGYLTAGTKLKATIGWNADSSTPQGTDIYGFSALPGGYGYSNSNFSDVDDRGYWWTATDQNTVAYYRGIHYNGTNVSNERYVKSYFLSVRCVKD